jgi:glycosyltransferase involved in cell wall biosynthesis
LEERIARSPLARRHRRIGWVDDTHRYYNALSLLALPSIDPESFGRTSVEAQACGVPVLGSDVGGIPETLKPGITGLLVPPGNVDAWRDAILMLCEDPARRPMAGAARDFVQRQFSATVIAAEFVRLLGHTLPRNSDGLEHR